VVYKDANVLRDKVERIAAILIATSGFDTGESKVSPTKPHSNPLRVMLSRSANAMTSPGELRLISPGVNSSVPVPTFIGRSNVYLTPKF